MGIKWEITDWNKSQGLSWEMTFMDPGPLSSVRQSEVLAGLKNAAAQLCKEKLWQKSPKQIFCKVGCGGKAALTSPLPSPALLALSLVLCHTGPCLCQGCSLPWVTQDAPGSSQGVDMVIQAKKKKKFPCILHFPCKVNANQMGENIFFSCNSTGTTKYYLCTVWWALKGRVKRFCMESFVRHDPNTQSGTERFGTHWALQMCL